MNLAVAIAAVAGYIAGAVSFYLLEGAVLRREIENAIQSATKAEDARGPK